MSQSATVEVAQRLREKSGDHTEPLKDKKIPNQREPVKEIPHDNAICESFMKTLKIRRRFIGQEIPARLT